MDQAGIQAKINRGYGIAARYLGAPFTQYRPGDPLHPLDVPLGTLLADFDPDPAFSYKAPGKYGNPVYYGLFDGAGVLPGDYLADPTRTFFVASHEPNKPTLCVACNAVLTFARPEPAAPATNAYLGDLPANETTLMAGWPASVLQGSRGMNGATKLPGDARMAYYEVLVPAFSGITLEQADRAYAVDGRALTLSSCELSDLGWRLTAELADT